MPHKRKTIIAALAIAVGAFAMATLALALFLPHLSTRATFTCAAHANITQAQADTATLTKQDLKLVKQAAGNPDDTEIRSALLKDYKKAQILRHSDVTYFDLTTNNKQRIVIAVSNSGKSVQKYLWEDKLLLVNDDNKELQVVENNFKTNVTEPNLPQLDPLKDNPNCLEIFTKKETSKKTVDISAFDGAGYSGKQTLRAYESQYGFETTAARGTVFPVGTSLTTIALTQKLALETLLDSVKSCEIDVDKNGNLSLDTLFVTFKRQTFQHERGVTITNPLPEFNGAETYIYSTSADGIVEINYQIPQFVNTAKDIVASNIMSKPTSMEYCDEWHMDKAASRLYSLVGDENTAFVRWSEYKMGESD
jgi:tRNA(Leu) C34 or U34 (ribose-2'-O)-methylase TrmL